MTQANSILQKKICSYDPWLTRIFFQEVRTTITSIDNLLYNVCEFFYLFLSYVKLVSWSKYILGNISEIMSFKIDIFLEKVGHQKQDMDT